MGFDIWHYWQQTNIGYREIRKSLEVHEGNISAIFSILEG